MTFFPMTGSSFKTSQSCLRHPSLRRTGLLNLLRPVHIFLKYLSMTPARSSFAPAVPDLTHPRTASILSVAHADPCGGNDEKAGFLITLVPPLAIFRVIRQRQQRPPLCPTNRFPIPQRRQGVSGYQDKDQPLRSYRPILPHSSHLQGL